jgi:phosphatidylinositol alpha 1,6-mannosyltransferase
MRVAIITESFPPDVNGVAHCVLRVAELLARGGHHPLVIAPRPPRASRDEKTSYPFPVVRVPAVPLPGYPGFRLGLPGRRVRAALIRHRAELVHLASPVVLGAHGAAVARRLGLPAVAVYQTDLPSYARAYRFGRAGEAFAWRWLRGIHNGAVRTLAPSTVTATGLLGQGGTGKYGTEISGTGKYGACAREPERLKQAFRKLAALRVLTLGPAQGAEPILTT